MTTQFDLEEKTRKCVLLANVMFRVRLVLDHVEWYPRGGTVGKACVMGHRYYVKYNTAAFNHNPTDMMDDTVPHEVAHLVVCWMRNNFMPVSGGHHGITWKRVCAALGGSPSRTTDAYEGADLRARRTRQFEYKTDSGRVIFIGAGIHNKMRQVPAYHRKFRDTKERIEFRHFTGVSKLRA